MDPNVIIESHLRHCWPALTGAYAVQTVECCVVEAMTGRHEWNGTKPTEPALRASFNQVHDVSRAELARVKVTPGGASLDDGEQHLWAHALAREDTWILCGPDRASMRFGYEQKQRERLVSLGALLKTIDYRAKVPLREHFEQDWLDELMRRLVLNIL